jgi:hypothetical protein
MPLKCSVETCRAPLSFADKASCCEMCTFRLRWAEKQFLQKVIDRAITCVETGDRKKCIEYAWRAIMEDRHMLKTATEILRPVVLAKIKSTGASFFFRMLERHAKFLSLPKPLRGTALAVAASDLGLTTRVETVRVGVATIKEECTFAPGRIKMNMVGEIGKTCDSIVVHKTKRKECIKRIVRYAQHTGVANVTLVWREFLACTKTMLDMALEAIAAVCRLKNVYVLDIHKQTYLFPFPIFIQMLQLMTNSSIFAINMGEDNGILESTHFQVLAEKNKDGSIPLRRWFVEVNQERRSTLVTCKLVSKVYSSRKNANADNPNAWTIARRRDKELWVEGHRHLARLAWFPKNRGRRCHLV